MGKTNADLSATTLQAAPPTHAQVKLETLTRIKELCQEVNRTDLSPVGVGALARAILNDLG